MERQDEPAILSVPDSAGKAIAETAGKPENIGSGRSVSGHPHLPVPDTAFYTEMPAGSLGL